MTRNASSRESLRPVELKTSKCYPRAPARRLLSPQSLQDPGGILDIGEEKGERHRAQAVLTARQRRSGPLITGDFDWETSATRMAIDPAHGTHPRASQTTSPPGLRLHRPRRG